MLSADEELVLPEHEFTYLAGSTDRPWSHFIGRWNAMKPHLARMLKECDTDRPLRVVDLGSCTGFFSLKSAHYHPEADVVGVEGSIGIGNGTVGMVGTAQQILATDAVQTHIRWIQRLRLTNCFVAPEVWDYTSVCELASHGRPICDVQFLLSVVHHIDGVSVDQYAKKGLSRVEGFVDLMGKLLLLAPRHFVELPNRPWLENTYNVYGTQRQILEAATKASGLSWNFKGPIYTAEWFGLRELWVLEVADPMPSVDVETCPFPRLYRGQSPGDGGATHHRDDLLADTGFESMIKDPGADMNWALPSVTSGLSMACPHLGGIDVDPGLMLFREPYEPAEAKIGEALNAAPTALLLAHLKLRDAMCEATDLLREVRSSLSFDEPMPQHAAMQPHPVMGQFTTTSQLPLAAQQT